MLTAIGYEWVDLSDRIRARRLNNRTIRCAITMSGPRSPEVSLDSLAGRALSLAGYETGAVRNVHLDPRLPGRICMDVAAVEEK